MRLRMELFVDDMDASIGFYTEVLGFRVTRRSEDYVVIRRGHVVLGLGPAAKLGAPARGKVKGAGVEIVLELERGRSPHRHP